MSWLAGSQDTTTGTRAADPTTSGVGAFDRRAFLLAGAALVAGCGGSTRNERAKNATTPPPPSPHPIALADGQEVVIRATLRVGDAAAIAVAWVDASRLLVGDRAGRVTLQSLDGAAEPVGSDGSPVWAVAVSGSTLIWGGSDGVVHERRGGSTREVAQEASGIFSLAAGSEGALAVGTGNGRVRVFGGDERTLRGLTGEVLGVASAPVGATGFAACSRDGEANVWDDTGRLIARMRYPRARKGGAMNDIAWPGLDQVITASDDGVVRVWYAPGGDFAHAWPRANGSLRALAVSPKSGLLADAGAAGVVRLSSPGGEVIKRLAVAAGTVWDLAWSPAGDVLAAACNDGTIRLLGLPD